MTRTASVSLDLDNLWAYLKTHGDPAWRDHPSFLPVVVPRALDLFGDLQATVFVIGADAARDDGADAVGAFVAAGHEIGNHSWGHEPWLHRYARGELDRELARTEDALVAAGAPRPRGFRGPGFSVTRTLLELLVERGYRYDTSTLPTWIGPLARAAHNRGLPREDRAELFGPARDALLPLAAHRRPDGLVEIPVTTMPMVRLPIHGSYLARLHQVSPRLARLWFAAALRLCVVRGVEPTLLLHPTDLLDDTEAPGMSFFPAMAVPGADKRALMRWAIDALAQDHEVVGTGEHAARLLPARPEVLR